MATAAPSITKTVMMIRLEKRIKNTHGPRRIGSSMRALRDEIARHSKVTPESVKISGDLNNYILMGSVQGFYGVKVALEKSSGVVKADLAEKKKAPAATTTTATSAKETKSEKPKSLMDRLSQKTDAEKEAEKKASAPSASTAKATSAPAANTSTTAAAEKKAAQPKPSKEAKPTVEKKQAPKKAEKKEEKKDEGSTAATSTGT